MYGLLGKTLSHSYSQSIHEHLSPEMSYHLYETDDVETFLQLKSFRGLNVTMPYKKAVIPCLDYLDETAEKTGVVNTIVRKNDQLIGYNTDFLAARTLVKQYFPGHECSVAIVGNGATKASFKSALEDLGYEHIDVFARHPDTGEYPLRDAQGSYHVLVNTTPVGTFPDIEDSLSLDLEAFQNLSLCLDVIYNPLKTSLMLDAETRGIQTKNGLEMLIRQAAASHELFTGKTINESDIESLFRTFYEKLLNIVLIGLPYAGKTHYARKLSRNLDKRFVDIDQRIEAQQNISIEHIFQTKGEAHFRSLERQHTIEVAKRHQQLIATGGGVVLDEQVMRALKQNGIIIFLDLDETLIDPSNLENRPLVKAVEDLKLLKEQRQHLYKHHSDIAIRKDTWEEGVMIRRIEEALYAHIHNQWS